MLLTRKTDYALVALARLALDDREPSSARDLADELHLPLPVLRNILKLLAAHKVLVSTRGPTGGYRLVRPANEITPWDVIQALGGPFFKDDFCDTHPGQLRDCIHNSDCSVRVLWRSVEAAVRSVLESVSLADLTRNEASMAVWLDTPRHADGRGA